jgi:hypothetical protein
MTEDMNKNMRWLIKEMGDILLLILLSGLFIITIGIVAFDWFG